MNPRRALGRGGFAAAACVACCAPPIIGALGVTAGLAATVGIFLGLAAAISVVLGGAGWIVARARRAPTPQPVGFTDSHGRTSERSASRRTGGASALVARPGHDGSRRSESWRVRWSR